LQAFLSIIEVTDECKSVECPFKLPYWVMNRSSDISSLAKYVSDRRDVYMHNVFDAVSTLKSWKELIMHIVHVHVVANKFDADCLTPQVIEALCLVEPSSN
jgi:hypothetical protein